MTAPPPTPEELAERALTQCAILQCALRRVASAWHRTHSTDSHKRGGMTWVRCDDPICRLAHDAVEGRYVAASRDQCGRVLSMTKTGTP